MAIWFLVFRKKKIRITTKLMFDAIFVVCGFWNWFFFTWKCIKRLKFRHLWLPSQVNTEKQYPYVTLFIVMTCTPFGNEAVFPFLSVQLFFCELLLIFISPHDYAIVANCPFHKFRIRLWIRMEKKNWMHIHI